MTKKERENLLIEIEELKKELNDRQKDFAADYDLSVKYLEDSIVEYADSLVNIHYSDIDEYYQSHKQEAADALKKYAYNLSDFEDLTEAMRKGSQLAEYQEIYNELMEDNRLEDLKRLLAEL